MASFLASPIWLAKCISILIVLNRDLYIVDSCHDALRRHLCFLLLIS